MALWKYFSKEPVSGSGSEETEPSTLQADAVSDSNLARLMRIAIEGPSLKVIRFWTYIKNKTTA